MARNSGDGLNLARRGGAPQENGGSSASFAVIFNYDDFLWWNSELSVVSNSPA